MFFKKKRLTLANALNNLVFNFDIVTLFLGKIKKIKKNIKKCKMIWRKREERRKEEERGT